MNHHLAILKKQYLDAILAGRKTIESRLYQTKQKWLSQVNTGDKIFLKASSGPVMATAIVDKVKYFENLTAGRLLKCKSNTISKSSATNNTGRKKQIRDSGFWSG